jgi:hypothetical protein
MVGDPLRDPRHPDQKVHFDIQSYFVLSQAAQQGRGFQGPEWIVLAQCSTLNRSVWCLWARVLATSSPGVRGILAYEEASPRPKPAIRVAERFFALLDRGVPFLPAWAEANGDMKWSALVHKEAREDTLPGISRWQKLSDLTTSRTKANYHGHGPSLGPPGEPVYDTLPPFWLKLEHQAEKGLPFLEVTPDRYGDPRQRLIEGEGYRWTVHGDDIGTLREVSITVVYLRDSLRDNQPPWNKLFREYQPTKGIAVEGFGTSTVILRPDPNLVLSSIAWECRAGSAKDAGLDPYHSYLWFRVAIRTDVGSSQHDFKTIGLYF